MTDFLPDLLVDQLGLEHMALEGDIPVTDANPAELNQEWEEENNPFHFVELDSPEEGIPGPGPSTSAYRESLLRGQLGSIPRSLDDSETGSCEEPHPTGGVRIRMDETLHERWRSLHPGGLDDDPMDGSSQAPPSFDPFESETDWHVARWAIKEGVAHGSFDRLLAIPGVCDNSCFLWCHLIRSPGG